jgi:8-oxo-dGTP pyrophosphatase MutT (NUDIX family)
VADPTAWKRLGARELSQHRIFRLGEVRYESPRNAHTIDAVVLDAPDWVNIIAVTPEQACVMIRQYRFGTASMVLEIPGGMIDESEPPLTAAVRELREETGYEAARWTSLGSIAPNPAFQSNRLHMFLAEGAVLAGEQQQDPSEDIAVELISLKAVDEMLAAGHVDHALVAVAFHKLNLLQRGYRVG